MTDRAQYSVRKTHPTCVPRTGFCARRPALVKTSFAKIDTIFIVKIHASPVNRIQAHLYIPVKRRIWPIPYCLYMPVFHRIPINTIHVCLVIPLVPNLMLPKSTLPKGRFRTLYVRSRQPILIFKMDLALFGGETFYKRPPAGKISVPFRQRPNTM